MSDFSLHFTTKENETYQKCPFPNAGDAWNKKNKDAVLSSLFSDYILPNFFGRGYIKMSFHVSHNGDNECQISLKIINILLWQVMEKAMAPHSSTLAWKIPWTEEPVRLQSMGSLRVGHYWATSLSLLTFLHWRRKWQPTPVFLPGESQGRGSLVGCRLWGRTESDTTEAT